MTTEEKKMTFEIVDWSVKEQVQQLFPFYMREKIRVQGDKTVSNIIDIDPFTLQTPFKDQTLLKSTQLLIEPGKRSCLFGRNGTGKTLLFERIADHSIKGFPTHLKVHHLKELDHQHECESVFDTILHSHEYMMTLRRCEKELALRLSTETNDAKISNLKDVKQMVDMQLTSVGSATAEDNITKMLRVLGFDEFGWNRPLNDLSGGLRMRVALAMAFFADADLLLLDEPTNHLDFPSVMWLENRLRAYRGSFLLVTHDRDLLIAVTTSCLLLEEQQIKYYPCGFGEFEKRKAKEDEKRDKDAEDYIKKNRNPDPSTPTGRRVHDLKKWQDDYRARMIQMQGKFTFPPATDLAPATGEVAGQDGAISLIKLSNVRFSYDESRNLPFIFDEPINFEVTTKSRVGIMGPNGAGKSTLLKLITKKIKPTYGTHSENPNFVLAYFGQHSTAELKMDLTPMEFMQEQFPSSNSGVLRAHLAKTGVSNGVESTRMQGLSYSQRSCVIFSKLTFVCPHLLIMDEPTNFLDIDSVDSLISAANKFPGALLVVTHSRHFLRRCAKTFLSIVPGQFLGFNDMKAAEAATYTFIQELESGVKIDASQMSAGGGARHDGEKKPAAAAAAAAAEIVCPNAKFTAGEVVQSMWTDKKYYEATIQKIVSATPIKYAVFYPAFNKTANIPEAGIKKSDAANSAEAAKNARDAASNKLKEENAAKAKASADHKWTAGEKCMCQKADGRFYEATIQKVNAFDMFVVDFVNPAETVTVAGKKIRIQDESMVKAQGGGAKAPQKAATNKGGPQGKAPTNKGH